MSDQSNNNGQRPQNAVFQAPPTNPMAPQKKKSILFSDEIPFETIPLPSEGKVYPPGSPLHGKKTVDIKVMGTKEENILSSVAYAKAGTMMDELLKSCIMTPGVEPEDMIIGDRNAILLAVRSIGYGSSYGPIQQPCVHCGAVEDEHYFELNALPIRSLDIDPIEPGANLFAFKLPRKGFTVHFKFITGKDERDIAQAQKVRKQKFKQKIETTLSDKLLYSIVSVEGVTDRAEIAEFVNNHMSAQDARALRKYMEDHEPEITMVQNYECTTCGEQEEVPVPIGDSFFWPA